MISDELKMLYTYLLEYKWHVFECFVGTGGSCHICLSKYKFVSSVDRCVDLHPMEPK
ncbi:hypothetical protein LCGC14_1479880 [marine sediment metagenome]|uniref:Uncharacterized protein n=1 Tax=marine sediment metagenome TaxID=412755 RepID=A0A0F9JVS6_9ZZZZ